MANILSRIHNAYRHGRLLSALRHRATPLLYGLTNLNHSTPHRIALYCPDYREPSEDQTEKELTERIFHSFRKMKEDQKKVPAVYRPSSMWQDHIDTDYSYLNIESSNLQKFHFFLANFGTWKTYHGVEATTLIRDNMRSPIRRRYLRALFAQRLRTWQWFYNSRKPLSDLTYPLHGNQSGAYIDNVFVGLGSFFNEIYGELLSGIVSHIERPVVADLGAGYGKLAYFALRHRQRFCFLDFDLPETLCLAAYYLMRSWPEKRVLLYGEDRYSPEAHDRYDLIFMPSYEMARIGENSIDLFVNKNSLGEMDKEAVCNYISLITSSTRYFFHMNHDNYPSVFLNDSRGLLGYEYPVPREKFSLLFRYPDIGSILSQGTIDYQADIFAYLYERTANA